MAVWAWYMLVLPALVLNYFGQGALLLSQPQVVDNPFFRLAPGWALVPLVALATVATVIASQAVISGTFSLTTQAIQLGYLPRELDEARVDRLLRSDRVLDFGRQVFLEGARICSPSGV